MIIPFTAAACDGVCKSVPVIRGAELSISERCICGIVVIGKAGDVADGVVDGDVRWETVFGAMGGCWERWKFFSWTTRLLASVSMGCKIKR